MHQQLMPQLKPRVYTRPCQILATGRALPPLAVDNASIIRDHQHAVTDAVVRKTIGVVERRVAGSGVTDADLLAEAAELCLTRAGVGPEVLSKLIVNKFVGDRVLPMTGSLLQRRLKCSHAVQSFDVDGGTNSFLHALDLAAAAINSGDSYVLIASGGVHNRVISRRDPRHAFLYGDGAAAMLLGPASRAHIEAVYHYSNHEYADLAVGFSRAGVFAGLRRMGQDAFADLLTAGNWREASAFLVEATCTTARELLRSAGLTWTDIDLILLTENSGWLRQELLRALGIDEGKTLSLLARYGNTMSAMLPLLLDEALTTGRLAAGGRVMALSIGEGVSGGGFIYSHGAR